jgi:hypothetical protein
MSVEEQEEIPWSMLVDYERKTRSRFWYVLAAMLVAAVVGFTAMRWVEGRRHGELPVATTATVTTVAAVTTSTALATEADLLAADPAGDTLAATATAEWFVTDYFTVDGAPSPELSSLFATDAVLPDLPGAVEGGGPVSFVEWARATATRSHPGGVVVTVLFRTLYESADGRIERSAVRAVDVVVLVDGDETAVGELPMPAAVPAHRVVGWAVTGGTPSPEAETAALESASSLGSDPVVTSSGETQNGWRVVVTVADPSGARFPVAVRSER